MKFKKRHIEVEAIQWNGMNKKELIEFAGDSLGGSFFETVNRNYNDMVQKERPFDSLYIETNEGNMSFGVGDWIIKEPFDKERKFYPCKQDVFEKTYEKIGTEIIKEVSKIIVWQRTEKVKHDKKILSELEVEDSTKSLDLILSDEMTKLNIKNELQKITFEKIEEGFLVRSCPEKGQEIFIELIGRIGD